MRHLKILTIIILSLICTRGFAQIDIENAIISALMNYKFKTLPNDTIFNRKGAIKNIITHEDPEIVLVNETEAYSFDNDSLGWFKNHGLPSIDSECYLNFKENNKLNIQIDSIHDFKGTIIYMSRKEVDDIFNNGGWDNYYKTFGNKFLVIVSRFGINNDKSKAFIYYSSSIAGRAGAGFYLILEKVYSKWVVKESMPAWKS